VRNWARNKIIDFARSRKQFGAQRHQRALVQVYYRFVNASVSAGAGRHADFCLSNLHRLLVPAANQPTCSLLELPGVGVVGDRAKQRSPRGTKMGEVSPTALPPAELRWDAAIEKGCA
jgi:hypothetical protein